MVLNIAHAAYVILIHARRPAGSARHSYGGRNSSEDNLSHFTVDMAIPNALSRLIGMHCLLITLCNLISASHSAPRSRGCGFSSQYLRCPWRLPCSHVRQVYWCKAQCALQESLIVRRRLNCIAFRHRLREHISSFPGFREPFCMMFGLSPG